MEAPHCLTILFLFLIGFFLVQTVMQDLVTEKLGVLKEHLDENGIDLTIVTFKWFLTIFVDGLPTEVQ